MHRYFGEAFKDNRAWNEIVTELVSAEGNFEENGAANFVLADTPGTAPTTRRKSPTRPHAYSGGAGAM